MSVIIGFPNFTIFGIKFTNGPPHPSIIVSVNDPLKANPILFTAYFPPAEPLARFVQKTT